MYDWIEENQVKNVSKKSINGITHPCQMPLNVMRKIIAIIPSEFIIIDPFMGSGTTAVACIKENRNFIGFEIDAAYYKIAQQNIQSEKSELKLTF